MLKARISKSNNSGPRSRRAVTVVIVLLGVSLCVGGCFKKWDMQEVEQWYEEKPKSFDDYMRLARQKTGSGETEKGMQLYRGAIQDLESQYGADEIRIATPAEELGVLQEKLGRYGEAEQSFRKAYTVREKNLPPHHLDMKRSKQKLIEILKRNGKDDEANEIQAGKKESAPAPSSKPEPRVRRHKHLTGN